MIRRAALGWLCLVAMSLTACAPHVSGRFTLTSQQPDGATLSGDFDSATYAMDGPDRTAILLLSGPPERPDRAVLIRMFWRPRAGRTPIAPSATNAMIHYAIFTGDGRREVGIYSGAGFFFPDAKPGRPRLSGGLWDATLSLAESTDGFADLLGVAHFKGRVTAVRDDEGVRALRQDLQQQIADRLR